MIPRTSAHAAYYELNPSTEFQTGDIWSNLPTFGLLKESVVSGIIITPSCDLAWCKTSTATFLPILSFEQAAKEELFHPTLRNELRRLLETVGLNTEIDGLFPAFAQPDRKELELLLSSVSERRTSKGTAAPRQNLEKIEATLDLVRDLIFDTAPSKVLPRLQKILKPKDWQSTIKSLITNSFRPDVHFLPDDKGDGKDWPSISTPSLALFRCPITVPINLLRDAQYSTAEEWEKLPQLHLGAVASRRPVKFLSLKTPFLQDLLARFTTLYSRMGSPDFTPEAIASFAASTTADS